MWPSASKEGPWQKKTYAFSVELTTIIREVSKLNPYVHLLAIKKPEDQDSSAGQVLAC